ncbi:deoxycytidylate 5-hydromethyltransferase [Agrobacterium phage OLIVR5]|uniref:Deoxycytidylate 5-hydromethyltransferase n=3 Tax=Caudoviricetes TaxID=2731619 RepID=A0A858MV90_9CAUD|nr:deoxycytidylate 5-hydromethyltransferase [Agrobacterium phage OLIVR5]QIW87890.1 deoxycytidylate 5-hydromethyltransferase [Agrobacterium phage OLIVR5]QIW88155.1 deoxycytidylate 5-hydromethyltransferase [Agrobacterium phage OLIVR6]
MTNAYHTFEDAYADVLDQIVNFGNTRESSFGSSKELRNFVYEIANPSTFVETWPTERKPSEEYAKAFADWVLSGSDVMPKSLIELNPIADKFNYRREDLEAFELPSSFSVFYGPRIAQQYDNVKNELRAFPETRRAVISVLDGINDNKMLSALRDDLLQKVEYPCTVALIFDITKDTDGISYLNVTSMMRSQNMVSVWPYDFFIAKTLLEKMAKDIGVQVGTVSGIISSAHIYGRDVEYAKSFVEAYDNIPYGG